MTCRAASSATTCAGASLTGDGLSYDNEGRLVDWQEGEPLPSAPTTTALYDGAGNRVQSVRSCGNCMGPGVITSYLGGLEEVTTAGTQTTTTAYYGGLAESVNGALSYLLSDGLGSVSLAVSASTAQTTAMQLYGPYGAVREQSGTLPTDKGYTGQVSDAATSGLDYYGARYYDPVAGQFTSADMTLAGGLNRYAYVAGNPETRTDPTGHAYACPTGGCSDPTPSPPPPPAPPSPPGAGPTGFGTGEPACNIGCEQPIAGLVPPSSCFTFCVDAWKASWTNHANSVRSSRLAAIDAIAREDFIAGDMVEVFGLLLGIDAAVDVWDKLVDFASLISLIADNIVPNFGLLIQDKGGSAAAYSGMLRTAVWANTALSLVTTTMAAIRLGGMITVGTEIALGAIDVAVEGVPGVLTKLFGSFVAFAVVSVGAQVQAAGEAVLARENDQQHMPIATWCKTYGGGACG